ncbi:MAG: cyclic nucleotide-binding domain-containing protein [Magnetococcales bacterium]|nr:cyclic nucleotide-binding domain-containing protein [Magnetococcales bacterium]
MQEISHLTNTEILEIINILPFFSPFNSDERVRFAGSYSRICLYHTGEFLIQEGGDDQSLFILLAGAASVVKEGASIPLSVLEPGQMFGEVGFVMQRKRTSNIIAHPPAPVGSSAQQQLRSAIRSACLALSIPIDPAFTTMAIQFHRDILQQQKRATRIKLKEQIIQCLTTRVEGIHEQLTRLTEWTPLLSLDQELESALRHPPPLSLAELERTKERIIEQLIGFMEELNQQWIFCVTSAHV